MTKQSSTSISLVWHLGNGLLGAFLVVLGVVVVSFIIGFLTYQFDLIEKLTPPLLGFACCCTIIFVAKRVFRRLSPPSHFKFGVTFHMGNVFINLLLGFILLFIPSIGIPILDPPENIMFILLYSSMAVILVLIHTVASVRSAKYIIERRQHGSDRY